MSSIKYLLIILALCIPVSVQAVEPQAEMAQGVPLSPGHLTVLGVTVGAHTLNDAVDRLGPAEVFQNGPDGAASFRVCYTSPDKEFPAKIVFEAGPQGLRKEITSIKLIAGQVRFEEASRCAASELVTTEPGTMTGLRIGMTTEAFKAMLGAPTDEGPDRVEYEFHTRKMLSADEVERLKGTWPYVKQYPYLDVYSSVTARFHEGSLVRLVLSSIETETR